MLLQENLQTNLKGICKTQFHNAYKLHASKFIAFNILNISFINHTKYIILAKLIFIPKRKYHTYGITNQLASINVDISLIAVYHSLSPS